jgi:hypothetical protein
MSGSHPAVGTPKPSQPRTTVPSSHMLVGDDGAGRRQGLDAGIQHEMQKAAAVERSCAGFAAHDVESLQGLKLKTNLLIY